MVRLDDDITHPLGNMLDWLYQHGFDIQFVDLLKEHSYRESHGDYLVMLFALTSQGNRFTETNLNPKKSSKKDLLK
jgi:hypothetical protein